MNHRLDCHVYAGLVYRPEYKSANLVAARIQPLLTARTFCMRIIYGQSSGGQEWLFDRGRSETSVYPGRVLKLSGAEGVREAVLAGQGFAVASQWMFAPELKSGEVVSCLDEWTVPPMDLWVIYPSGRLTSARARAFVKWFEKTIQA